MEARYGASGRITSTHVVRKDRSEVTVTRTVYGPRRIEVVRPDRTRLVSVGVHRGYLERPLAARPGFVARTYVGGGRSYGVVYRTYSYRNAVYYGYVPAVYYRPGFYSWAWSPWPAPIVYSWGWNRSPWYGYYGGYFAPAPYYPTAALWLTDFLIAENLRLAYENRSDASGPPPPQEAARMTLTPEVKQAIAEEVRQQLADAQASAAQPMDNPRPSSAEMPPALDPKHRIFVVSMNLDITTGSGECGLTPGDIILRTSDSVSPGNKVSINVLNSKPGGCPANTAGELEAGTLQEMHNQFREQLDTGLKTLADNQGTGGLPSSPSPDPRLAPAGQAVAERNVEAQLLKQEKDASRVEEDARRAANQGQ